MIPTPIGISGVCGSLRQHSYNLGALRAAAQSLPDDASLYIFDRQILVFLNMYAINQPEAMIARAAERFNDEGDLIYETSRNLIRQLTANRIEWTRRLRESGAGAATS